MKAALTLTLIALLAGGCIVRRTSESKTNGDVMDLENTPTSSAEPAPVAPLETVTPARPEPVTPEPAPAGATRQHVIATGDTLWSLATKYYGDGKQWPKIVQANPGLTPEKMPLGKTIVIP